MVNVYDRSRSLACDGRVLGGGVKVLSPPYRRQDWANDENGLITSNFGTIILTSFFAHQIPLFVAYPVSSCVLRRL